MTRAAVNARLKEYIVADVRALRSAFDVCHSLPVAVRLISFDENVIFGKAQFFTQMPVYVYVHIFMLGLAITLSSHKQTRVGWQ